MVGSVAAPVKGGRATVYVAVCATAYVIAYVTVRAAGRVTGHPGRPVEIVIRQLLDVCLHIRQGVPPQAIGCTMRNEFQLKGLARGRPGRPVCGRLMAGAGCWWPPVNPMSRRRQARRDRLGRDASRRRGRDR